jgi:uncharacterized protein
MSALILFSTATVSALEVPPLTGRVIDQAGVFSNDEQNLLTRSLETFARTKGPQIVVLTIPSLEGDTIEQFSMRAAEKWRLGDAKRDDGILLIVAVKDRRLRIEVGQGLEGALPDIIAGRIIRERIVPYFQKGQMNAGLFSGVKAIAERLGGQLDDLPSYRVAAKPAIKSKLGTFAVLLIFGILLIFMRLGNSITGTRRYSSWGGPFSGGGGSGFGGFSGGGFSGGGGGFSGGGSSGSW